MSESISPRLMQIIIKSCRDLREFVYPESVDNVCQVLERHYTEADLRRIAYAEDWPKLSQEIYKVGRIKAQKICRVLIEAFRVYDQEEEVAALSAEPKSIFSAMKDAEARAIDALARYKFWMFGYHAGRWVNYNRLLPKDERRENPFRKLVKVARTIRAGGKEERE